MEHRVCTARARSHRSLLVLKASKGGLQITLNITHLTHSLQWYKIKYRRSQGDGTHNRPCVPSGFGPEGLLLARYTPGINKLITNFQGCLRVWGRYRLFSPTGIADAAHSVPWVGEGGFGNIYLKF